MDRGLWAINRKYSTKISTQVHNTNTLHIMLYFVIQKLCERCNTNSDAIAMKRPYMQICVRQETYHFIFAKLLKSMNNGFQNQSRHITFDLQGVEWRKKKIKHTHTHTLASTEAPIQLRTELYYWLFREVWTYLLFTMLMLYMSISLCHDHWILLLLPTLAKSHFKGYYTMILFDTVFVSEVSSRQEKVGNDSNLYIQWEKGFDLIQFHSFE